MKFSSTLVFTLLAWWACAVGAVTVPNADTPLFYFVASSGNSSPNLLPLRITGAHNSAALTGVEAIGRLYFYQGKLVAQDPSGSSNVYRPYISATLGPSGCTTFGPLSFVQGSTTNKCGLFGNFQIQSNMENSQLGAKLVFNYLGGFFACGASQDIWYKTSPDQGPGDCTSIDLYTVPVVN